jgi:M6 family metalloprotease-like protein
MNYSPPLRSLSLSIFLACSLGQAGAAPFGPEGRATEWTQPDGKVLNLRVFGDEYYARTETTDGYTVVYNSADGAYYYATPSADGSQLIPSGTKAGGRAPAKLEKHLDLRGETIRNLRRQNQDRFDGPRRQRWESRVQAVQTLRTAAARGISLRDSELVEIQKLAAPVIGEKVGLTILVQFPDDPQTSSNDPVRFPTTQEKIERFCNLEGYQENGNTGSVRDYYFDQSEGNLTYTQTVTQIITLPRARNFYNFSDYPRNREFRTDASRVLITDAIQALKDTGFDFSSLSKDSNNLVEATNVFFAGRDSGSWARGLWPQQWLLATPFAVGTEEDPIFISSFQITNIPNSAPVIGTFCHENGHLILGYPDLYSALEGEGVGEHCLMGSGNYLNSGRTPAPINAHFKDLVGWANITELAPTDVLKTELPSTGNVAYRIRNPKQFEESFVFENRGEGDRWAQYANDKGIAIWHIDERIDGNNHGGPYGVSLKQADGKRDLENSRNRGDKNDLFDLVYPKFDDDTSASARWKDASRSGVKVKVLSNPQASMGLSFGGIPLNTIIVKAPNGGEKIFPGSTFNVSWESNIQGNVKLDLYKGEVLAETLAADLTNTGSFAWTVPSTLPIEEGFSLKISSLTNPVAAEDASDGTFGVSDMTFPADGVMPHGWVIPSGTKVGWTVTTSNVFEGAAALVSSPIGDGKVAAISYRSRFLDGTVGFYIKVSSEQKFDFARFYIDDVAQILDDTDGEVTGLSGSTLWKYVSFPISAGDHTLKWTYEKDDSYAVLQDRVWIDGVSLPPTTQEIAVAHPDGTDLTAGAGTITFSPTATGYSSAAQKITIQNVGTSDLSGLKAFISSGDTSDFKVTSLATTKLAPGASTTLSVTFNPLTIGERAAVVTILSNDADEGRFSIHLAGDALGAPQIGVNEGEIQLVDNKGSSNFGKVEMDPNGKVKTFTIINRGAGTLSNLAITQNGKQSSRFLVGPLATTTLEPGATTTFDVTFFPSSTKEHKAALHIASDDTKSGVFDINLKGKGVKPSKKPKSTLAAIPSSPTAGILEAATAQSLLTTTTVEVVGGIKYRALTITKLPGVAVAGTVEVSPNLLDWYSGNKHTSVMVDNAKILKVRDNTPLKGNVKRYIRLN